MKKEKDLYIKYYAKFPDALCGYDVIRDKSIKSFRRNKDMEIINDYSYYPKKRKKVEVEQELLKEMTDQFESQEKNLSQMMDAIKLGRASALFSLATCTVTGAIIDNPELGLVTGLATGSIILAINYNQIYSLAGNIVLVRNFLEKEDKINEIVMNDQKIYNGLSDETKKLLNQNTISNPISIRTINRMSQKDRNKILGKASIDHKGREIWYQKDIEEKTKSKTK